MSDKHSFHKRESSEDHTNVHLLRSQETEKPPETQPAEEHDTQSEPQLPVPSTSAETMYGEGVKDDANQDTGNEDRDGIAP